MHGTRAALLVILLIGLDSQRMPLLPLPMRTITCLIQRSHLYMRLTEERIRVIHEPGEIVSPFNAHSLDITFQNSDSPQTAE